MANDKIAVAVLDPTDGGQALDLRMLVVDENGFLKISGTTTGSFSPIGLSQGIRTTKVTVTDVATLIPLNAYANRNTLLVRVGGAEKVYIGNSDVSVAGVETPALSGNFVDAGFPFFQFEQFAVDVIAGTSTAIYGICEAGKSSFVWIIEVG